MNEPKVQPELAGRALGLVFVAAGFAGLGLSFAHGRGGFATQHDPGPWMLPRFLGLILLAGGTLLALAPGRKPGTTESRREPTESGPSSGRSATPWALPALVGGLAAYVAALPWAGFVISTTVFATGLLCSLKVVWWRALLAGVLLAATADGLFSVVLKVPLPAGVWN